MEKDYQVAIAKDHFWHDHLICDPDGLLKIGFGPSVRNRKPNTSQNRSRNEDKGRNSPQNRIFPWFPSLVFFAIFILGPVSGPIWFPISGRRPKTCSLAGRLDRNTWFFVLGVPLVPFYSGTIKILSIAKNHLKPSQEFSERFGPLIYKMKGFCRNSPQKFTQTSPETWQDKFLGMPCRAPVIPLKGAPGTVVCTEITDRHLFWEQWVPMTDAESCRWKNELHYRNRSVGILAEILSLHIRIFSSISITLRIIWGYFFRKITSQDS